MGDNNQATTMGNDPASSAPDAAAFSKGKGKATEDPTAMEMSMDEEESESEGEDMVSLSGHSRTSGRGIS